MNNIKRYDILWLAIMITIILISAVALWSYTIPVAQIPVGHIALASCPENDVILKTGKHRFEGELTGCATELKLLNIMDHQTEGSLTIFLPIENNSSYQVQFSLTHRVKEDKQENLLRSAPVSKRIYKQDHSLDSRTYNNVTTADDLYKTYVETPLQITLHEKMSGYSLKHIIENKEDFSRKVVLEMNMFSALDDNIEVINFLITAVTPEDDIS